MGHRYLDNPPVCKDIADTLNPTLLGPLERANQRLRSGLTRRPNTMGVCLLLHEDGNRPFPNAVFPMYGRRTIPLQCFHGGINYTYRTTRYKAPEGIYNSRESIPKECPSTVPSIPLW
jgi:hypothetical protein